MDSKQFLLSNHSQVSCWRNKFLAVRADAMDASLTTAWEKNPKQLNLGAESDRGGMMVAKDLGGNGLNGGHGEGGDDGDMRGWRRWRYEVETIEI
ncbi:hypothetical protein ACFX13_007201 [Malus domestica]